MALKNFVFDLSNFESQNNDKLNNGTKVSITNGAGGAVVASVAAVVSVAVVVTVSSAVVTVVVTASSSAAAEMPMLASRLMAAKTANIFFILIF